MRNGLYFFIMSAIALCCCFVALLLPPVSATAEVSGIPAAACRQMVTHTPDANVTYRPGADIVNGKPVVPADLPSGNSVVPPQEFNIRLTINLARRLGIPIPSGGYARLLPGHLTVNGNAAAFNGQPLQDDALSLLCHAQTGKR